MHFALLLLVLNLPSTAPVAPDSATTDIEQILQATFNHRTISDEFIHVPRFQKNPVIVYIALDEHTSDITQIALTNAILKMHPKPGQLPTHYFKIKSLTIGRNSATIEVVRIKDNLGPNAAWNNTDEITYLQHTATVKLVHRDGEWVTSKVKIDAEEKEYPTEKTARQ